jgi:hypothetical protein
MRKCINIIFVFVICMCIPFSFTGCKKEEDAKTREVRVYREWYEEIIQYFKLDAISKSVKHAKATCEYRVLVNHAFAGYWYYSVQEYADGTGEFLYLVHKPDALGISDMELKKTISLKADEVQSLLKAIEENDFWNIPTVHPDELDWLDGRIVFIEGYENGKIHFIKMACPPEEYGINKIYNAFENFSLSE